MYCGRMMLDGIRRKVLARQYEFSRHAVDQSVLRGISVGEIEEAIAAGIEVIGDYPDDKYGPSCLVLAFTASGRPLHVLCSHPTRPLLKVITVYQPDPAQWADSRTRIRDD